MALDLQLLDCFLSPEECAALISDAEPNFLDSMVSADGSLHSQVHSRRRTSKTAALSGSLCDAIVRRAASLLGLAADRFETLQCVKYEAGAEFSPHFDVPVGAAAEGSAARGWTLLAYLNHEFEGGETFFPLLDLKVRPQQGCLLAFRNRGFRGEANGYSLHAGLPVHAGVKYACNLWCSNPPHWEPKVRKGARR